MLPAIALALVAALFQMWLVLRLALGLEALAKRHSRVHEHGDGIFLVLTAILLAGSLLVAFSLGLVFAA